MSRAAGRSRRGADRGAIARSRSSCRASVRSGDDSGLATLELALLHVPLLMMAFGGLTFGYRYYVQHALSGVAMQVAQACVAANKAREDECSQVTQTVLGNLAAERDQAHWSHRCAGNTATAGIDVTVRADPNRPIASLRHGHMVTVELACRYKGLSDAVRTLIRGDPGDSYSILFNPIRATASVPFVWPEMSLP